MHLTETIHHGIEEYLRQFVLAPVNNPELLPTVLPLILGAIVIELYFGKHTTEDLGWNTAVGNAIIWITTGVTLLLTTELSIGERYATYSLIGLGGFIAYMDFYHKWSSTIAFLISSSAIVYTLAYIGVIMIKTSMEVGPESLKAAGIFFLGVNLVFKFIQGFETPAQDQLNDFMN